MSDPIVARALEARRVIRAEFEDYRLAEYLRAEEACRGAMLNARGRKAHVDPISLFMGNDARAQAYASDELKEWWRDVARATFEQYASWRAPEFVNIFA